MKGKIIKAISGFYYVKCEDEVYECKARGIFKKEGLSPLVGDNVEFDLLDEIKKTGNIIKIFNRTSTLFRPKVSNVDQALIIFSITKPEPNLKLLDKFLILMEKQNVNVTIAISKCDLEAEKEKILYEDFIKIYKEADYNIIPFSSKIGMGIDDIKMYLKDKCTCVAGPSGVGKSTLVNSIQDEIIQKTGDISKKLKRGKNTTRHTHLIELPFGGNIIDTPGFTSLELRDIEAKDLKQYFLEFYKEEIGQCKFVGCNHISEPSCVIKEAVKNGIISQQRYSSYVDIYNELKDKGKY